MEVEPLAVKVSLLFVLQFSCTRLFSHPGCEREHADVILKTEMLHARATFMFKAPPSVQLTTCDPPSFVHNNPLGGASL